MLPHVDWSRAARSGSHPGAARRVDGLETPNIRYFCGLTNRHVADPSQAYGRYPTVQADALGSPTLLGHAQNVEFSQKWCALCWQTATSCVAARRSPPPLSLRAPYSLGNAWSIERKT